LVLKQHGSLFILGARHWRVSKKVLAYPNLNYFTVDHSKSFKVKSAKQTSEKYNYRLPITNKINILIVMT